VTRREITHPALRAAQIKALVAVIIFTVLVSAKFAAVRWLVVGGGRPAGIVLDALLVFGVFALVDLFFSDMRFRALLITDAIFSALLLAIAVYSRYYSLLPTRDSLAALGQAATVTNSIATLLNPLQLLLFVDLVFLLWWGLRAKGQRVDVVTGCERPTSTSGVLSTWRG
jgi:phosphoglycerol transferase MdoB-like AlkP superfamily enzyme